MLKEFKVTYGRTPATQAQLDAIEEIVVEQEIGKVWEARIKIPICIIEDGSWDGEGDPAYTPYARVRIEARIGDGDFVPLIDGRITDLDPGMDAEPGLSALTLTVQDDTTLLHRETKSNRFQGQHDSAIAKKIFGEAELGGSIDVEDTGAPNDPDAIVRQHGTGMQLLRALMRRHRDFYAYVLPGKTAGTSDCFFKRLPESTDSALPPFVLTGPKRNISGFNLRRMSNQAAKYEAASFDLGDMTPSQGNASSLDESPSDGENASTGGSSDIRIRRLPPGIGDYVDISGAAAGAARDSGMTLRADGAVLPECYKGILTPYRKVEVQLSNTRYSAKYVIFKVTHTLSVSEYTQSFSVRGSSISAGNSSNSSPAASAVAGAGFNTQQRLF